MDNPVELKQINSLDKH